MSLTLLIVNIAIFALMTVGPIGDQFQQWFAQSNQLVLRNDDWWRVLSAAFLHARATPLHIAFNMYALYLFGPHLERAVGSLPFLLLYLAAAAAGGLAFFLWGGSGTAVGASGAIFGLFGAWLIAAFRARHTTFGRQQLRTLLILLAINLALPLVSRGGFFGGPIAWEAHLGGLVAGAVIAGAWFGPKRERTGAARAVIAAVVLVAALLAVAFVRPVVMVG